MASDSDGEALAAMRKAQQIVAARGQSWPDFCAQRFEGSDKPISRTAPGVIWGQREEIKNLKARLNQAYEQIDGLGAENRHLRKKLEEAHCAERIEGSDKSSGNRTAPGVILGLREEVEHLKARLGEANDQIQRLGEENMHLREGLEQAQATAPIPMAHSRAAIAALMREIFTDPQRRQLTDRELARQTGLSPTTIGNWRRRCPVHYEQGE